MKRIVWLGLVGMLVFIITGCYSIMGVETGHYVGVKLAEGQRIDEILKILSEGKGNIGTQTAYSKPESGYWSDVIKNDRVLAHLLATQDKKHKQIYECISVGRGWGFLGFDVFHLFFDENKTLVDYYMEHFN